MNDGTDALQAALVARLRDAFAAAVLTTLDVDDTVSVVDFVTEGVRFPYVVVGETIAGEWDTKDSAGTEQTPTLEVWTRYRGRKQARQIAAVIYESLHQATFPVDGQQLVLLRFDSLDMERAADGLTHVGRLRYRALMDSTA